MNKFKTFLYNLYRTDISSEIPKIVFSDASLMVHKGKPYYKAFGTGMVVLNGENVIYDSKGHITTELKPLTPNNSQTKTNNLTLSEGYGIVDVLNSKHIKQNDNLIIYCDNLNVMNLYHNRFMAEKTKKKYQKLKTLIENSAAYKNIKLEIRWIKGHSKTFGNHQADTLAKSAANSIVKVLGLK